MRKIIVTILAACTLIACAPVPQQRAPSFSDAMTVERATTAKRDDFQKLTEFEGPNLRPQYTLLYLRATKFDAGDWIYQIYIRDNYYDSWRFYDSAFDNEGTKLSFLSISRRVGSCRGGCDYYEDMAIQVTRDYLQKKAATGLQIKVIGTAGEFIFSLPPGYIEGFLQKAK